MARNHSMNVTKKYVETLGWGPWEALREWVANMRDAGAGWTIEFPDPDTTILCSPTSPSLANLLLFGSSTKSSGGETIGQFGEGAKMAAAVLTRRNAGVRVDAPAYAVTYHWKTPDGMDEQTLHARIDTEPSGPRPDGLRVELWAAGLRDLYNQNVLADAESVGNGYILKKPHAKGLRLYNRGLYVTTLKERSLYDWNLNTRLNRDRNIPDMWDVKWHMGHTIDRLLCKGTDRSCDLADEILANPESLEFAALKVITLSADANAALKAAVFRRFGDTAVIASHNSNRNSLAAARGHKVVEMHGLPLSLKSADEVVEVSDELTQIDLPTPAPISLLLSALRCPAEIRWFTNDTKLGLADYTDAHRVIWLNADLAQPGREETLYGTLVHEAAHLQSKASDGSIDFEEALSDLSGRLAVALITR